MSDYSGRNLYSPADLGHLALEQIQNPVKTMKTGFARLDKVLKMYSGGRVLGIQAPTSQGKTTVMLDFAQKLELPDEDGNPQLADEDVVLFATVEDSVQMLATRVVSRHSLIPVEYLYKGGLADDTKRKLEASATKLQAGHMWLYGHSENAGGRVRMNTTNLLETARFINTLDRKVRVIFIDYLQRLATDDVEGRGVTEKMTEVMNNVKDIAIATGAAVWIATQVSREVLKERKDKMPKLGDAMNTSNFEQSCDAVVSMYMPAKFEPLGFPLMLPGAVMRVEEGSLLMEVQKQKLGPTGKIVPAVLNLELGVLEDWIEKPSG